MAIDALKKERAVSSSRDKSVHVWKVLEESQLLFKNHSASVDCVSMINEEHFVSGSEDG
jgi:ribosomal RNA-processing protein 9